MLPYALIGKAVVGIIVGCLLLAGLALFALSVLFVWFRGLTFLSNLIWRNYDPHDGEQPPQRWRKVSAFLIMLRDMDFEKKDEVWEEIESGGP